MKLSKIFNPVAHVAPSVAAMTFMVSFAGILPCMAGATFSLNPGQKDEGGTSSFAGTGGTWTSPDGDSHRTPVAGNDYVADDFLLLRTPEVGSSFQFPGRSLVLSSTDSTAPKNCALKLASSATTAPNVCAAFIVSDLTIKNSGICLAQPGIAGLAGQVTIPKGYFARLGVDCIPGYLFSLQANLKGEGTAIFPLRDMTVASLTGDNSAFTGDVTTKDIPSDHDGAGTLRFYSSSSWFGDGGRLEIGSSSTTLEFVQDMEISTPNRTIDFGSTTPMISVAEGKTVFLGAKLVGSSGFVKTGKGTLCLMGSTEELFGRPDVREGLLFIGEAGAMMRLSAGARSLLVDYAFTSSRYVGGSAWLAIGKGDSVPEQVPNAMFKLLRANLATSCLYTAGELIEPGCNYWVVLRMKTTTGEVNDLSMTFAALGAEHAFRRGTTGDTAYTSCFTTPAQWLDSQGEAVSLFEGEGDYCIDSEVTCRNLLCDLNSIPPFLGHSVVMGSADQGVSCNIVARETGLDANVVVFGRATHQNWKVDGDFTTRLMGKVFLQENSVFSIQSQDEQNKDVTTLVSSAMSGTGRAIFQSSPHASHVVRLSGENGGLTGPVEFEKGNGDKDLTVEFASGDSWFGDMAAQTANGLVVAGGTLVKFSASLVGKTPNRGVDLGEGDVPVTFEVSEGKRVELDVPMRGNGFVKTGKGTLALTSKQLKGVTGTIRIDEGVLEIPTKRSFASGAVLQVADGAEIRYSSRPGGMAILLF